MKQEAQALPIIRLNSWEAGFESRSVGLRGLTVGVVSVFFPVHLLRARLSSQSIDNLYWIAVNEVLP